MSFINEMPMSLFMLHHQLALYIILKIRNAFRRFQVIKPNTGHRPALNMTTYALKAQTSFVHNVGIKQTREIGLDKIELCNFNKTVVKHFTKLSIPTKFLNSKY